MISIDSVERSILELEQQDTTFATCEKLAILYCVRDHLRGYAAQPESTVEADGESEFLKTANGRNTRALFAIMDEVMDAIKTLYPKMYDHILEKIKDI